MKWRKFAKLALYFCETRNFVFCLCSCSKLKLKAKRVSHKNLRNFRHFCVTKLCLGSSWARLTVRCCRFNQRSRGQPRAEIASFSSFSSSSVFSFSSSFAFSFCSTSFSSSSSGLASSFPGIIIVIHKQCWALAPFKATPRHWRELKKVVHVAVARR